MTQEILLRHCREKQVEAINQLSAYPNIQYEFLKQMVTHNEFDDLKVELKLAYLNTMCQTDFYEVPNAIRLRDFPLDEALKICQKYNHTEALIAIDERLGRIEEAMKLFLTRYQKKGYLNKISQPAFDKDMQVFDSLFSKIKELPDIETRKQMMITALEKLSLAIPYGVSQDIRERIVQYLINITMEFLEQELSYSEENLKKVNELLANVSYNLTFGDLQRYLLEVLRQIRMNKTLWREYDEVSDSDGWKLDMNLVVAKILGTKTSNNCISCKKKLNFTLNTVQEVIVFDCTHSFHINCIEKNECPFCAKIDSLEDRRLTQKAWSPDILDLNKLLQLNAELVTETLSVALNLTDAVATRTTDVDRYKLVYEVFVYFDCRYRP